VSVPERVDCELLEPPGPSVPAIERSNEVWPELLLSDGPAHHAAVRRLHALMTKAAYHQVAHMSPNLPVIGGVRVDDIVKQAADEATVAALGRLASFEGRSRFTTWAYKFGILHAANEVRRNMWRHREVNLDELPELVGGRTSPEQHVEHLDFAQAVGAAIEVALTPHQRKVAIALLVEEIPIDVLAERMGTKRNALYKTLFDARGRLRSHLTAGGYLTDAATEEMSA
jgi:RNA polymerase sigma-70 factor (ECF subfamily)